MNDPDSQHGSSSTPSSRVVIRFASRDLVLVQKCTTRGLGIQNPLEGMFACNLQSVSSMSSSSCKQEKLHSRSTAASVYLSLEFRSAAALVWVAVVETLDTCRTSSSCLEWRDWNGRCSSGCFRFSVECRSDRIDFHSSLCRSLFPQSGPVAG